MTEFELMELIIGYNSGAQGWIGLYVSSLSAYLIVAYLAGKELTVSQTTIVSSAFALMAFLCTFAASANAARILDYGLELAALNPNREISVSASVLLTMRILMYFGILVALKFMWDVRHPKTE